ncbi:hypothetical protein QNI19_18505 [Cytophagaceae bacterium DM2B3-1]|uniref:Uncharacterized protein n=1 Tax=Xanthocytophaga flava TaxID=3048013 RepID=A0ABT7CMG5_9BACT|nr:hypothetical protein [Xanthocytophaga flavus]MDJ1494936.1 hypothetical protein [Xanthocytophaga flavus]
MVFIGVAIGFLLLAIIWVCVMGDDIRYPRSVYPKVKEKKIEPAFIPDENERRKEAKQFVKRLDELGYFKWTAPEDLKKVKAHIAKYYAEERIFYTLTDEKYESLDYRTYYLNHDTINEGDAKSEFLRLGRTLEKLGFVIDRVEQTLTEEYTYTLYVNDLEFDLTPSPYNSPDVDFVDFINVILQKELKVEERLYAIDLDDAYEVIFLDQKLYQFLRQSNLKNKRKPFLWEGY